MTNAECIRVLIVDDHELVRSSLALFLHAFPELEMVGEAGSGPEALEKIDALEPDVVIMDLVMPGMGGPEAIRHIREAHPRIQCIALSSFSPQDLVQQAVEAGAIGYLTKTCSIDELADAIHAAARGQSALAPEAQEQLDEARRAATLARQAPE